MNVKIILAAAALLLAAAGAAGDEAEAGKTYGGDFDFIDDNGLLRRISSLAPMPVAVYFGYSNCPDKCGRIMARLAAARKEAGVSADAFKVLFITVDPERDTRTVLRDFLKLFGDGFIGARIPPGQLRDVTSRFGMHYERPPGVGGLPPASQGEQIHFFDGQGRPAAVIGSDADTAELAATIASLFP